MKKILVMPDGNWLSHTSRPFEIAKILRQIGHEVIFACEGNYTKLPEKNGFRVLSIKTIPSVRLKVAPTGQTLTQGGLSHWKHFLGIQYGEDFSLSCIFRILMNGLSGVR